MVAVVFWALVTVLFSVPLVRRLRRPSGNADAQTLENTWFYLAAWPLLCTLMTVTVFVTMTQRGSRYVTEVCAYLAGGTCLAIIAYTGYWTISHSASDKAESHASQNDRNNNV